MSWRSWPSNRAAAWPLDCRDLSFTDGLLDTVASQTVACLSTALLNDLLIHVATT